MTHWSKEDLEEMCGDDIIDQLAFLSGCFKHRLSNDKVVPDGWIIPDELLRKFAELIVRGCSQFVEDKFDFCGDELIIAEQILKHFGVKE